MDGTLVVVVEMSLSTWLVCAEVPGLERRAMMKMSVDEAELLSQLLRLWKSMQRSPTKRGNRRSSGPALICCRNSFSSSNDGPKLAKVRDPP